MAYTWVILTAYKSWDDPPSRMMMEASTQMSPLQPQSWWYNKDPRVWKEHMEGHLKLQADAQREASEIYPFAGPGLPPTRVQVPRTRQKRYEKFFGEKMVQWSGYADAPERTKGVKPVVDKIQISTHAIGEKVGLVDPLTKPHSGNPRVTEWFPRGSPKLKKDWGGTARARVPTGTALDAANALIHRSARLTPPPLESVVRLVNQRKLFFPLGKPMVGCCWTNLGYSSHAYHSSLVLADSDRFSDMIFGEIIATSHDLTPKGSWWREIPFFQENPRWWITIFWPDDIEQSDSCIIEIYLSLWPSQHPPSKLPRPETKGSIAGLKVNQWWLMAPEYVYSKLNRGKSD